MINDERTSDFAELTLEDDRITSKVPRKLPIILTVVFAAITLSLLATTILFAVQRNTLESGDNSGTASPSWNKTYAPTPTRNDTHVPTPTQEKTNVPTPTHDEASVATTTQEKTNVPTTTQEKTNVPTPTSDDTYDLCLTDQCIKSAAAVLTTMNKNGNPCQDFYDYACGGWIRRVIPVDEDKIDRFSEGDKDVKVKLKELIDRHPQVNDPASYAQVRSFYNACLDLDTINRQGAQPLTSVLDSLGGWPVLGAKPGGNWNWLAFDFEKLWSDLQGKYNTDTLLSASVDFNNTNTNEYTLKLGLPDFLRSLQFDERKRKSSYSLIQETLPPGYREKLLQGNNNQNPFLRYKIDIAKALGADSNMATQDMTQVNQLEYDLYTYALSPSNNISLTSRSILELERDYNQINWARFYEMILPESVDPRVSGADTVEIWYPYYLRRVVGDKIADPWNNRVIANFMIWRFVDKMVPYLGETFLTIYQQYQNALWGTSASVARWRFCVDKVNTVFPLATGRMYVDEYFSEESKAKVTEMAGNLRTAMGAMIETSYWLERSDRLAAEDKLQAMGVAIGFPDWLKENARLDALYTDLEVVTDEYFNTQLNYRRWVAQNMLSRLRMAVDKSLWQYDGPTTLNAFYNSLFNGITITAGIMQPPFYHPELPGSWNYGGAGVVLGHEITHGFDSNGRRRNKDGNWVTWWSDQSIRNFEDKTQCMISQYSEFVLPEINRNVNGERTLGENIADNGGLREAYMAFKNNVTEQSRLPGLQDLTDDQMFFLSYAQTWCSVLRPRILDNILNDVHSPDRFRVIGPLQNNEDFSRAFNCSEGSYMNKEPKCKVWS